jgi:ABC-type histidine transport system ATPase subunit
MVVNTVILIGCYHCYRKQPITANHLEVQPQFCLIDEPESAVGQALKEAFLSLRQVAESGKGDESVE